mmetsp:Transcript_14138/g.14192  ORF Transcript_14138/g.14192 Transcript_14138/m.14192 type:complete len:116 (+) Transcript_14138:7-354(+)
MSCFTFLEKFILSRCYPPNPSNEPTLVEVERPSQVDSSQMPSEAPKPIEKKPNKKESDVDELLKEIEPTYTAPKKVDYVVMTNKQAESNPKKGTRFDMEEADFGSWGETEEFKFD